VCRGASAVAGESYPIDAGSQVVYLTCKRDASETLVEAADADLTELTPL